MPILLGGRTCWQAPIAVSVPALAIRRSAGRSSKRWPKVPGARRKSCGAGRKDAEIQRGPDYWRSFGDPCVGAGVVNELPAASVNKIRVQKAIRLAAVGGGERGSGVEQFTAW